MSPASSEGATCLKEPNSKHIRYRFGRCFDVMQTDLYMPILISQRYSLDFLFCFPKFEKTSHSDKAGLGQVRNVRNGQRQMGRSSHVRSLVAWSPADIIIFPHPMSNT